MTVQSSRSRRRSAPDRDMSLQRLGRDGDALKHALQEVVGADVIGERLERQDETMPDHVEREVLQILTGDVPASTKEREGAAGEDQVDRRARTRSVADVLR